MRLLVVHNPRARACPLEVVLARLRARGHEPIPCVTTADGGPAAIAAMVSGVAAVVCVGGDGTAHRAANALAGTGTPLCVVPCGAGNDFARALGVPLDPQGAMDLLETGTVTQVDLGVLGDRYFLNAVSVGLAARVVAARERSALVRAGRLAYPLLAARALLAGPRWALRLTAPGHYLEGWFHQVTVANGPSFGGGFRVAPEARLDEGLLDVVILEAGLGALCRGALAPGQTLIERLGTHHWRVRAVELGGNGTVPASIDGEEARLSLPLSMTLAPRHLSVYAARAGGSRR